jgi:hypothetical protein
MENNKKSCGGPGTPWHGGPIRPSRPPEGFVNRIAPVEIVTTYRMPFNSLELPCKRGIEAFASQACEPLLLKTSPRPRAKSQEPGANLKRPPGRRRQSNISIDHLNISLKGVSVREARESVNNLGSELLNHLAQQRHASGSVNIDSVDAGTIKTGPGESQGVNLGQAVAEKISESLYRTAAKKSRT